MYYDKSQDIKVIVNKSWFTASFRAVNTMCCNKCHFFYYKCAMYTCEAMERNKLQVANQYFTHLASKQTNTLDCILNCTMGDPNILKKLTGKIVYC